jgi:hypothetical protein
MGGQGRALGELTVTQPPRFLFFAAKKKARQLEPKQAHREQTAEEMCDK